MYINLILVPFIIIFGLFLLKTKNRNAKLIYISTVSSVLLFFASMRDPYWLTERYEIDTKEYKENFERVREYDWDEIWQNFLLRYYYEDTEADIGYMGLVKVVGYLTDDFNIFSLLVDLLFFIPFGIILYRYTDSILQIMFAFLFYIALIQTFLLGGARQIFAIGLDLISLLLLIDRKYILSIILFSLGITIHFSSFLFGFPLLLIWINLKPSTLKCVHYISFILFPIALVIPNQIIYFMGEFSGIEKYAKYGSGQIQAAGITFIALIELLSLFTLITIKKIDMVRSKKIRIFYVMLPFLTLFAPLIYSNGSMIRIALYFYLFLTLLVPYGIDCGFKYNRNYMYFIAITSLSLLILKSNEMEYHFVWENSI